MPIIFCPNATRTLKDRPAGSLNDIWATVAVISKEFALVMIKFCKSHFAYLATKV